MKLCKKKTMYLRIYSLLYFLSISNQQTVSEVGQIRPSRMHYSSQILSGKYKEIYK